MAYSYKNPISITGVKALVGNNRLEARPRSREFNRSLRAEIRDPAWMLARQWQMKEFKAEDRGSPAYAEVDMAQLAINQLVFSDEVPVAYDRKQCPLEAAVEAQPVPVGKGVSLQMGQHWRQLMRTLLPDKLEFYTALFQRNFKFKSVLVEPTTADSKVAHAQERTTTEVHELLQVAGTRAIDGYALYLALLQKDFLQLKSVTTNPKDFKSIIITIPLYQNLLSLPGFDKTGVDLNDQVTINLLNKLCQQFILTFHRLYFNNSAVPSWSVKDMAYEFSLLTETGAQVPVALTSAGHTGGDLHWYSVDQSSAANRTSSATKTPSIVKRFLPTEIQFPGSPNARWWEFEDRRVDFGALTGDPSDFGRMLLQEFMFLYQNDWFSLPFEVPVGMYCMVNSLTVTDVFNTTYHLQPAGAGQLKEPEEPDNPKFIDNDAGRWRLFDQTNLNIADSPPDLFVPPTVIAPLVGKPIEQVGFRREEATNLVWAVEQTISNGFARGMDGHGAAARVTEYLRSGSRSSPSADKTRYRYQLASLVAENWIPFVPSLDTTTGIYYLEQARIKRLISDSTNSGSQPPDSANPYDIWIEPRTSLLQLFPKAPYKIHEHEIPPAGILIDSAFRRARWFNGRTVLWFGRSTGTAPAGGSSGLTFDQLIIDNKDSRLR